MKDIFEFNHIDPSLSESDVTTLKDFYRHYHKKYWCFKKAYKRYKRLDETITISGAGLVIIDSITGGVTLNPIVLDIINGAGVLVASTGKVKNYKKKMEMSRIAYTTYDKVLVELRSALRGDELNKHHKFLIIFIIHFLTQELFHHYSHEVYHILVDGRVLSFSESAFDIFAALDYAHRDKSHRSTTVV